MSSLALVVVVTQAITGHQVGLSRGTWVQTQDSVQAEIVFAQGEAADAQAADALLTATHVTSDGAACPVTIEGTNPTEADGFAVRAVFACPHAGRTTVELADMLAKLAQGHRHLAHVVTATSESDAVAFAGGAIGDGTSAFSFGEERKAPPVSAYFLLGVEHILMGYDHLVFLFGLVLIGGRLRALLAVITAFTLAHSVSLALAVLGVVAPSGGLIEPLIALSIAYIGIENFFVKDANKRWRITAPFGLIHGFGFAGALAEVGMPKDAIAPALVLFNLGVEAGQLAVLALVLPLLWIARKKVPRFDPLVKNALSVGIVAAGLVWFVSRVFFD